MSRDAKDKQALNCHEKGFLYIKQIRSMSFEELVKARAQIEAAIELHRARERPTLIRMLERGKGPAVRSTRHAGGHPLRGKRLPPKYRNPDDHSQVWAGRGNKPRWLVAALKKPGMKLESFTVN